MSDATPPRGGRVSRETADADIVKAALAGTLRERNAPAQVTAQAAAPAPSYAMAAADLAPRLPVNTFDETPAPTGLPDPETPFAWLDRGWRPMLGVVCGVGFFYSFVAAPVTDRKEVDEAKLWVLCTLALGLAGTKTAERLGPGMIRPQGLIGGSPLVTR